MISANWSANVGKQPSIFKLLKSNCCNKAASVEFTLIAPEEKEAWEILY